MNSSWIISLILALVGGGACYLATGNIIAGVATGVVYLAAIMLFGMPLLSKWYVIHRKRHECFRFVNSFVVSLSVTSSLDLSFDTAIAGLGKEIESLGRSISELTGLEKVRYLESYFDTTIYRMFLSTLEIYVTEGGDIIALSSELLAELTRIEESENDIASSNRTNLIQFCLLWAMALVVVVFLRFGLSNFFSVLETSIMYLVCVLAFFALMLFSIVIYLSTYTGLAIEFPFSRKKHV
ncbi:MAG: hypothetical protein K6B65_04135 [Bacilli bacterium]|nr:hypothetical protein [Bacilli bacterium]